MACKYCHTHYSVKPCEFKPKTKDEMIGLNKTRANLNYTVLMLAKALKLSDNCPCKDCLVKMICDANACEEYQKLVMDHTDMLREN